MVLRAANRDLDGAHERSNTPRGFPVESAKNAVNQAGAIGVATTRRIEHFARLGAGNLVSVAVRVDGRAFAAARHDERLHVLHDVVHRPAGAFLQQRPFVIVQRQPVRDGNEALEIRAGEQRHGLARVEDERDASGLELFGVLQHAFAAVGGDNTNRYTVIRRHLDAVRMVHGARMERRDLVGIEVRGDEGLGAMLFRDRHEVFLGHALLLHPVGVRREVHADATHGVARCRPATSGCTRCCPRNRRTRAASAAPGRLRSTCATCRQGCGL